MPSFYTINSLCYAQFLHNKLALLCPQFLHNLWLPLNTLITTTNFSPNTAVAAILVRSATGNTTRNPETNYPYVT